MAISGVLELEAPQVTYPYGARSFSTNRQEIRLVGTAQNAEIVSINDGEYEVSVSSDGSWWVQLELSFGDNNYRIKSKRNTVIYDLEYTSDQFPVVLESQAENICVYSDGVSYYNAVSGDFYTEGVDYTVSRGNGVVTVDKVTGGAFDSPTPVGFRVKYSVEVVSPVVSFDVALVTSKESSYSVPPPVNVRAINYLDRVEIKWTELKDPNIFGYMVYASSSPQGGGKSKYTLLTPLPTSIPEDIKEVRTDISEIVSRTRKLSSEVSKKIIDEVFFSLGKWQVSPDSDSCFLTQYRSKPSLSFKNSNTWCFAVYKLRYDMLRGSRTQIVLERNTTEAGNAKAGVVIGDSSLASPFNPKDFISAVWDASAGSVEVHTGAGESFVSDAGVFTGNTVTIDLVTREDKLIEVYVDNQLVFTSVNAVPDSVLESQPISIVGQSGVVVRSLFFTKGENVDVIELTTSEESLEYVKQFSYTITPEIFPGLSNGSIYVVVTAIGFDEFQREEVESLYSEEVRAELLQSFKEIENYPIRTQEDIRASYIKRLLELDPYIDPKPGSVVSDILVGPPSVEIERAFILLDFASRAQSFLSLLEIDYQKGTQLSVEESEYKQKLKDAFGLTDSEVQELIDAAFERLAANSRTVRKDASRAVGEITFFTFKRPTETLIAPAGTVVMSSGSSAQEFETLASAIIQGEYADAYYNAETKRWEVTVPIRAAKPGVAGNVSPGEITQYSGTAFDGCVNNDATSQGQDRENNKSLAERAMLAYVSVDVGTHYGYTRSALDEGRVQSAKVVGAGDSSMKRDWDPLVSRNIGGKVDVYLHGSRVISGTTTQAATFSEMETIQVIASSDEDGVFIVTDPKVSSEHPIYKVSELVDLDFNASYDLSNLQILSHNTFALDMSIQRNQDIGAVVSHSFRVKLVAKNYVEVHPNNMPIISVSRVQIVNPQDGSARDVNFGEGGWLLSKKSDPYLEGNSVKTKDVVYVYYDESKDSPTMELRQVTDERVKLVGTVLASLQNRAIDESSIKVYYLGPTFTSDSGNVIETGQVFSKGTDYEVSASNNVTYIRRATSSIIPDGLEVSVDYKCPDQVVVDYSYDALVQHLQDKLTRGDTRKSHITADVLVKSAVPVPVAVEMTVHLKPGFSSSTIRQNVHARVQSYIEQLGIGDPLYQSDLIGVVEMIEGVDYVEVPIFRLTRDIGAPVNRELLTDFDLEVFEDSPIKSYRISKKNDSAVAYKVYRDALKQRMFVQLYEDDRAYAMQEDIAKVNEGYGRAYLENSGTIIVTPLRGIEKFLNSRIEISYVVGEDRSVRNIIVAPIEYLTVGFMSISIVEH